MIGLTVAVSVIGTLLISKIILDEIRIRQMNTTLDNLAQCFLTYITNPSSVDIIEDIDKSTKKKGTSFPNSEGF